MRKFDVDGGVDEEAAALGETIIKASHSRGRRAGDERGAGGKQGARNAYKPLGLAPWAGLLGRRGLPPPYVRCHVSPCMSSC